MNNGNVLDIINYFTNKAQSGMVITPLQYPVVINTAQLQLFKKLTGNPSEYTPQLSEAAIEPNKSQVITNLLLPFNVIKSTAYDGVIPNILPPLLVDSNGMAQIPPDFYYRTALSYKLFENRKNEPLKIKHCRIDVVNDDIWDAKLGSSIDNAKITSPMCKFKNGFMMFYPIKDVKVDFSYIKYPKNCVYDYYIDAYGKDQYLPQGTAYTLKSNEEYPYTGATSGTVTSRSVELEFNDVGKIDIISYALFIIGSNVASEAIKQYAELLKTKGL